LRILLDENLDWRLERDLPDHEVESVPLIGWAGIENGELLERAQTRFDILVTMDSKMVRELNVQNSKLAVIVLKAPSNTLSDTRPLMPKVLAQLPSAKAGPAIEGSALQSATPTAVASTQKLSVSKIGISQSSIRNLTPGFFPSVF